MMKLIYILTAFVNNCYSAPISNIDLNKMRTSQLIGIEKIIKLQDQQLKTVRKTNDFISSDAYFPEEHDTLNGGYANQYVLNWYREYNFDQSVCALKFINQSKLEYNIKTFPDKKTAEESGYKITHTHPCGLCSSLHDLGAYIQMPNVTDVSRKLGRRFSPKVIRSEIISSIGLTTECAEAWTYNLLQDKKKCLGVAIKEYGLLNIILGRFKDKPSQNGKLPPSIECDEVLSGAGFKFSVGRNRRNSGLHSSIERDPSEITPIDHSQYFIF